MRPGDNGLPTADSFMAAEGSVTTADNFVESRSTAGPTPDSFIVTADSFVTPDERLSGTPGDSFISSEPSVSTADSFVASVASSFSHGSPYSSLASPCSSQQSFFDSRCIYILP